MRRAAIGYHIHARVIAEAAAVRARVAVEPDPPRARTRQPDPVAVVRAIREVRDHHDVITRTAVLPPVKRDQLVLIVHVKNGDVLAPQTARVIVPVTPQPDQLAVEVGDAGVLLRARPVERISVPGSLEEFLTLEQHRDAGCREHERSAERGALTRRPAVRFAGPDFLGYPRFAVRHLVVTLGVDHA